MHAWGHPIKKISIAQFWTEFITLTSSLWQPSPIESTFLCFWGQKYGSCSERHLVSRRLEGGQRWRVQILHLPHSASKMPRVHRIVMDYVQGLKSVSRAKIGWQRAGGGRRGGENGLHVTVGEAVSWMWLWLWGQQQASCNHSSSCNAPWWSRLSHPPHCSIEVRPPIVRNTNEKAGCVFSSVRPQSRALLLWQVWKTRLHICFSSLRIQDFTNFVAPKNFTNLKVSTHSVLGGCTLKQYACFTCKFGTH